MRVVLNNLKKKYADKIAVNIDNFEFTSGKSYAILGANGAGKTTAIRLIAGLEEKNDGQILYNDSEILDYKKVSYMPQQTYLFDTTVYKNVAMGLNKTKENHHKIYEALESVGMAGFADKKATQLSGGESQRVAIARLLVRQRELILLDEPTSATDLAGNNLIIDYISQIHNMGTSTVIFITHNPSLALRAAEESIFMYNGKIIESGSSQDLITNPKTVELNSFLENWRI